MAGPATRHLGYNYGFALAVAQRLRSAQDRLGELVARSPSRSVPNTPEAEALGFQIAQSIVLGLMAEGWAFEMTKRHLGPSTHSGPLGGPNGGTSGTPGEGADGSHPGLPRSGRDGGGRESGGSGDGNVGDAGGYQGLYC